MNIKYEDDDPEKTIASLRTQLAIARERLDEARRPGPSTTPWNKVVDVSPPIAMQIGGITDFGVMVRCMKIGNDWYEFDHSITNLTKMHRADIIEYWCWLPDEILK